MCDKLKLMAQKSSDRNLWQSPTGVIVAAAILGTLVYTVWILIGKYNRQVEPFITGEFCQSYISSPRDRFSHLPAETIPCTVAVGMALHRFSHALHNHWKTAVDLL
jgi:hypothetical protein